MICSCCGRKKKIFESFENIGDGGDICVDCSDIMYRIHDAYEEKDKKEYESRVNSIYEYIELKKASEKFSKWFKEDFMQRNMLQEENE